MNALCLFCGCVLYVRDVCLCLCVFGYGGWDVYCVCSLLCVVFICVCVVCVVCVVFSVLVCSICVCVCSMWCV